MSSKDANINAYEEVSQRPFLSALLKPCLRWHLWLDRPSCHSGCCVFIKASGKVVPEQLPVNSNTECWTSFAATNFRTERNNTSQRQLHRLDAAPTVVPARTHHPHHSTSSHGKWVRQQRVVAVFLFFRSLFIGIASDEDEKEVAEKLRGRRDEETMLSWLCYYWWKIRSIYSDILRRPFFPGFSLTLTTMLLAGNYIKLSLLKILRSRVITYCNPSLSTFRQKYEKGWR